MRLSDGSPSIIYSSIVTLYTNDRLYFLCKESRIDVSSFQRDIPQNFIERWDFFGERMNVIKNCGIDLICHTITIIIFTSSIRNVQKNDACHAKPKNEASRNSWNFYKILKAKLIFWEKWVEKRKDQMNAR